VLEEGHGLHPQFLNGRRWVYDIYETRTIVREIGRTEPLAVLDGLDIPSVSESRDKLYLRRRLRNGLNIGRVFAIHDEPFELEFEGPRIAEMPGNAASYRPKWLFDDQFLAFPYTVISLPKRVALGVDVYDVASDQWFNVFQAPHSGVYRGFGFGSLIGIDQHGSHSSEFDLPD
jgi:hypothetical protein